MDTFQYVMLGLGAILVLSNLPFGRVKGLLSNLFTSKEKEGKEEKVSPPTIKPVEVIKLEELVDTFKVKSGVRTITHLVAGWESVRDMCVEFGLPNSVDKLDAVFPTFLDLAEKQDELEVSKKV